jgi:hypothetical protein
MQRDDALEIIRQVRAPLRLALAERLLLAIVGRRQVVDAGEQRSEESPVGDDAADRDAAEADAVIAALAADQARARAFAARVVIGDRDLERGIDRLGAGIAEEHVVEVGGRERGEPARQLERLGMGELERRRIVELGGLVADRRDDGVAVVAGIGAPHPGGAIEHGAAIRRVVVHVLGARDQPGRGLERPVGRERNPEGFEIVGDGGCPGRWCRWHGCFPCCFDTVLAAAQDGCYQPASPRM